MGRGPLGTGQSHVHARLGAVLYETITSGHVGVSKGASNTNELSLLHTPGHGPPLLHPRTDEAKQIRQRQRLSLKARDCVCVVLCLLSENDGQPHPNPPGRILIGAPGRFVL